MRSRDPPPKKLVPYLSRHFYLSVFAAFEAGDSGLLRGTLAGFCLQDRDGPYNCLNGRPKSGSKESHISVPQALVQTLGFLIGSARRSQKKKKRANQKKRAKKSAKKKKKASTRRLKSLENKVLRHHPRLLITTAHGARAVQPGAFLLLRRLFYCLIAFFYSSFVFIICVSLFCPLQCTYLSQTSIWAFLPKQESKSRNTLKWF